MKLELFIKELHAALISRGIDSEVAKKHVVSLYRSFTPDDLKEIEAIRSADEINQLADNIANIARKNNTARQTDKDDAHTRQIHTAGARKPGARSNYEHKIQTLADESDVFEEIEREEEPSTKGLMVFWGGLVLTLPITLFALGIIFGAFAAAFLGLIALIIGGIAALVVLVAAGAGVSLIGIIYGITQLFSFPAAGIYEIGLGIIVAGIVLLTSVLIYNMAVRFIPWVISYLAVFLRYVCGKIKLFFIFIRKECYKL